ncbi:MAG: hypothetical protein ACQEVT_07610 [Pseudomonadota bacterium]
MTTRRPAMSEIRARLAVCVDAIGPRRIAMAGAVALLSAGVPAGASADTLRLLGEKAEIGLDEAVLVRAYQALTPMDDAIAREVLRRTDADLVADWGVDFDFVYFFVYMPEHEIDDLTFPEAETTFAAFQFMTRDSASQGWRWRYVRDDADGGSVLVCEEEWKPGCHMSMRWKK